MYSTVMTSYDILDEHILKVKIVNESKYFSQLPNQSCPFSVLSFMDLGFSSPNSPCTASTLGIASNVNVYTAVGALDPGVPCSV